MASLMKEGNRVATDFVTIHVDLDADQTRNQRAAGDRRRALSWQTFRYACCGGRRRGARRDNDSSANTYEDYFEPRLIILSLFTLTFSCLDVVFTSILLDNGSHELNPFLVPLIEMGPAWFVSVKLSITAACVSFLVLHKNFLLLNRISCAQLLVLCFMTYLLLMCYQLFMIGNLFLS